MSELKIYVWIDGIDFDAKKFSELSTPPMKGSVCFRKLIKNGSEHEGPSYWKSEVFQTDSENLDNKLGELLDSLKGFGRSIPKSSRVVVQIVSEYETTRDLAGYYFSSKLVSVMSELGAALDIDVVEKI